MGAQWYANRKTTETLATAEPLYPHQREITLINTLHQQVILIRGDCFVSTVGAKLDIAHVV